MKQYIQKLIAVIGIYIVIVGGFFAARMYIARNADWTVPAGRHILFMGASQVQHNIIDSLTSKVVNCGKGSERYMYTYIKLERYLAANPQIDTIFLECSSTDLWQNTDYKYHVINEQSFFVEKYWPLYTKEQWTVFKSEPKQVAELILQGLGSLSDYNPSSYIQSLGGYVAMDTIPRFRPELEKPSPVTYDGYGNKVNYDYLRRIIDYCKSKDVKLYLVYFPVYKPENYYDQQYCDSIRRKLFDDVEYLDYSKWDADDSERADAHHLNYKGATRFTNELRQRFNL